MSRRVVRVYQEDWWPFQNLPHALRAFERETGIRTELSWDKVGVGLMSRHARPLQELHERVQNGEKAQWVVPELADLFA